MAVRRPVKTLPPVHPNVGLEAAFRRKLQRLVDELHSSVDYWLTAAYRVNSPEMAADESPAAALREALRKLAARWTSRFDEAAPALARYFAMASHRRSDIQLAAILKKAGFSVELKLTRAVNNVVRAATFENVALIKSISSQYFTQVEGLVMRSVQAGRDLKSLTDDLQQRYQVTRRRAALIARDQNNKATAAICRARQQELGITQAVWVHSHGGNAPRPTHVAAGRDKVVYDVAEGWYDPHEQKRIRPGELINCRCVSRSVIPGLGIR